MDKPIYFVCPIRGSSENAGTDKDAPLPSLCHVMTACAVTGVYDVRVMYRQQDGHWVEL
jgi:hypothetical protein